MFRYKQLLETHTDEIARLLAKENGKTYAEAKGSLQRGIEVVEFATGAPTLLMGDALENVAGDIDSISFFQPVGVCAGITPFNFPAMVPLWMIPLALVCGNTFVWKPSEQVPLTAVRLGELLVEAGLPPGVLNIVHGKKEAVDALCTNPIIQAVSFVGSSAVARHVYATATAHGKRVQAGGGAKNFMLVMPDAAVEATVAGMMTAAFGCAGERCLAGSVAVTVGDRNTAVRAGLAAAAAALRVGPTDRESDAQMGPVVRRAAAGAGAQLHRHRAGRGSDAGAGRARGAGEGGAARLLRGTDDLRGRAAGDADHE